VDALVNHPRSSVAEIGRVVAQDTGLTAHLLRLANSALYGFPTPIETVSRAITIIGTQQLRDLTLASAVIEAFYGMGEELLCMDDFWRHSLACGVTARVLATYRQESNVERFFVAGLLHDIGRLVVFQQRPQQAQALLHATRTRRELLYRLETEFIGCSHTEIGGLLLKRWGLPDSLAEPVRWHHAPGGARRYPLEVAVVHVADVIAYALALGTSGEEYVPSLDAAAWERVRLPVSLLSQAVTEVERQHAAAVRVFLDQGAP
jgi:HD-like signal output (HDOD) protein